MKNKIYEMLRMYVAKRATHNLGKVEITDNEVRCYIDGKKLRKKMKDIYCKRYNIMLYNIPSTDEIYKTFNVNKPVHYIIKNVVFDKETNISAAMKKCHITFENCSFKTWIAISFADHITFKNNTYNANDIRYSYSLVPHGEFHISTRRVTEVNKLEFINDTIKVDSIETIHGGNVNDINKKQKNKQDKKSDIDMWLYAKEISFINTNIIDAESLEIDTEKLTIENSSVDARELSIYAGNITATNSEVNTDIADINAANDYAISQIQNINIKYNNLFVDGIEMNKNEDISKDSLDLQQKRLELINLLKKLERTCEKQISEEVRKQTLTRILKK